MLVYEKKAEGVRHLYGNYSGNTPLDADPQLTYKDADGATLTPVAGDTYVDGGSSDGTQRIVRKSDNKVVNVFIGDNQIIGDEIIPPVVESYKHTMRMYANNGTSDSEFNVIVENDDDTEFTQTTLEAWLAENGYTTADDKYYDEIVNVAGPEVTGVASKSTGVVVVEFESGAGADVDTFVGDTVTPAN